MSLNTIYDADALLLVQADSGLALLVRVEKIIDFPEGSDPRKLPSLNPRASLRVWRPLGMLEAWEHPCENDSTGCDQPLPPRDVNPTSPLPAGQPGPQSIEE